MKLEKNVFPGYANHVITNHFNSVELDILNQISKELYVTNGGGIINIGKGKSSYKYCIIKPTDSFIELFALQKEIIVLFSEYNTFETRSLDAIDRIENKLEKNRLDKLCTILISGDLNIRSKIEKEFKSNPEFQILIPFSYAELKEPGTKKKIIERFRDSLFSRDLFDMTEPLMKDAYFFGRNNLVQEIILKHLHNQNFGLFGLRKTGKTSLIHGVFRSIDPHNSLMVTIDCNDTSFNQKRWFKSLRYLLEVLKSKNNLSFKIRSEEKYTKENAASIFEKDLLTIYRRNNNKKIFFVFDEIENITFKTSATPHWRDGTDFILFWQSLRSIFQKTNGIFTYTIVGTNPTCIEVPTINGVDNPIFSNFSYRYIPAFNLEQTKEMITKLGSRVGIMFDSLVISKITSDFGGHPFLIRKFCSRIYQISKGKERPYRVDKRMYDDTFKKFRKKNHEYINMVLGVLKDFYGNEYEMLEYLAKNDIKTFKELASFSNEFTQHLIGYGIIDENQGEYFFKIELIAKYLKNKYKYKAILSSKEDMLSEISERRNKLETQLRRIIGRTLLVIHGESEATSKFLNILGEPRKSKYIGIGYSDLVKGNDVILYFNDLIKIINKHYDDFKNILGANKEEVLLHLGIINKYRADAHAKEITNEEMAYFRFCIEKIENKANNYFDF